MKNIIFFVDAQKKASGGGKIIYQYSNYINSLGDFSSSVAHLEKKKIHKWSNSKKKKINYKSSFFSGWKFQEIKVKKIHNFSWFNSKIKNKENLNFDREVDFVILPEIFAHFAEDFLIKNKTPYAIFVQNGYAIFPTNNKQKLNLAYKKAKFILSYSKDIDDCVSLAYPEAKNKILKVVPSINSKKLLQFNKKKNLITYMPRKLSKHSELVVSFLKNLLPTNWKVKPIDNLNENEVYKILQKSKIFLSFSELEGLGLPPIEAALAGNKIIGYTGEAGMEYWKKPIFTEIKNGEIKNFCKIILKEIKNNNFLKKTFNQRKRLSEKYSTLNEKKSIKYFLNQI